MHITKIPSISSRCLSISNGKNMKQTNKQWSTLPICESPAAASYLGTRTSWPDPPGHSLESKAAERRPPGTNSAPSPRAMAAATASVAPGSARAGTVCKSQEDSDDMDEIHWDSKGNITTIYHIKVYSSLFILLLTIPSMTYNIILGHGMHISIWGMQHCRWWKPWENPTQRRNFGCHVWLLRGQSIHRHSSPLMLVYIYI